MVNCPHEADIVADVVLYDSMYSTINSQAELLLSELVHTNRPVIYMGFGNISKKSGSVDCGLFAIIDIAFGRDPSFHVYTQKEMRQHFFKCIEQKKLSYCFHLCQLKSTVLLPSHIILQKQNWLESV